MSRPFKLAVLMRFALLVAVGASAVLLIEYVRPADAGFCGAESGCGAVKSSELSAKLITWSASVFKSMGMQGGFISLPHIGLVAYLLLFGLALVVRSKRWHTVLAALAGVGGVGGLVLFGVQAFAIGTFCKWCVAVDVAAVIAAAAAIGLRLTYDRDSVVQRPNLASPRSASQLVTIPTWLDRLGQLQVGMVWASVGALTAILPMYWSRYTAGSPLPAAIQELQVPGKVTVVSFTDFECPYCRRLHPAMVEMKQKYGDKIAFERRMMPLDGHLNARPAALAYLCVPVDKREEMADRLYQIEQLSPGAAINAAKDLGLAGEEVAACMTSVQTLAKLDQDMQLYERAEARGLPTTFVGHRMVRGADEPRLREAFESEVNGVVFDVPPWSIILAFGVITGALLAYTWMVPAPPLPKRRDEDEDDATAGAPDAKPEGSALGEAVANVGDSDGPAKAKRGARKKRRRERAEVEGSEKEAP